MQITGDWVFTASHNSLLIFGKYVVEVRAKAAGSVAGCSCTRCFHRVCVLNPRLDQFIQFGRYVRLTKSSGHLVALAASCTWTGGMYVPSVYVQSGTFSDPVLRDISL